ncbi:MAG: TFIIB-type zinc finger domain-containing protein [Thermofilum sp.]|jgi:ribosomal protein S27AE|nr:TFIIB-type zinc finger domain-containing protein [Thermofilum sp.]
MGRKALRCAVCGSPDVVAKIEGKYYCFKCGSALILENSKKMLQELKRKYLESSA